MNNLKKWFYQYFALYELKGSIDFEKRGLRKMFIPNHKLFNENIGKSLKNFKEV